MPYPREASVASSVRRIDLVQNGTGAPSGNRRSQRIQAVFSVHGKQVTPAGTVTTEVGARTAALDPVSGRVFLPSAKFQPAQQGQRPAMVPGSAHLLVVGPS
jgi:metal-dependent amidase/aminoacylase/carboxypeptidase family protein